MAPRIPRKKGQRANSKKHSDLYTDENPKGTIKGLGFAKVKDATSSVAKIKASGRSHAHKTQAAIAMEQRARVAGKLGAARVYRRFIEAQKKLRQRKDKKVSRYKTFNGRKYKVSDLPSGPKKDRLVKLLMKARRDVGSALKNKDSDAERKARNRVHKYKKLLGER